VDNIKENGWQVRPSPLIAKYQSSFPSLPGEVLLSFKKYGIMQGQVIFYINGLASEYICT
jgi:hypothetical protein